MLTEILTAWIIHPRLHQSGVSNKDPVPLEE
jgi:hypothetical protein